MPIEFRCEQCRQLLRTPDESLGKQARCPDCGAIQTVPGGVAETAAAASIPTIAPIDTNNPYQTSGGEDLLYPDAVALGGTLARRPVEIDELLSTTWSIYKNHLGECLLGCFVFFVVFYAIFGVVFALLFPLFMQQGKPNDLTFNSVVNLIVMPIWLYLFTGLQLFMLRVARGQPASVADLFRGGRWLIRMFLAFLIFYLCFMIGSLVIIGGLIFAFFAWPFFFLILDRDLGPLESITTAIEITRGSRLTAFLTWLLLLVFVPIAILCTCGIGVIFIVPFVQLLPAVFYLMMTGQPTAADRLR
jgi:hypothetical protein